MQVMWGSEIRVIPESGSTSNVGDEITGDLGVGSAGVFGVGDTERAPNGIYGLCSNSDKRITPESAIHAMSPVHPFRYFPNGPSL